MGARRALLSLLVICASVQAAQSQRAPETFTVSIDRQPLDGALQQLARQCDVQMIFFARVTEGLSAPAIKGEYTVEAAIERLLAGSGLTYRVIDPQTIEVRPLQAKVTDRSRPREISGAQRSSNDAAPARLEEVVVVGLAEQLVATRIATPLREIPQTISIVTGEQMRQRNEFTLTDVLKHAPGVTAARDTSLDPRFYVRAFEVTSFHVDGGAAVRPGPKVAATKQAFLGIPDLVEFDHVEILRGADGLFSGNGNPGGTISLVRKRPQRNFAAAFSATTGSWGNQRVETDITGPMAREGDLRGRAAAVYSRNAYFYDIDPHQRSKIFGAIEYDFTDAATLTAGASYQWDEASGVGNGVPLYADGRDSRLPRDMALEFDWTRYRGELRGAYLQYRQELAPEWALKFNASGRRTEAESAYAYFRRPMDPVTNEVNERPIAILSAAPTVHTQRTVDITLTGTLNWFGWREEVAIGGDFTRIEFRSDEDGYYGIGEPLGDPRAFDPRDYPNPRLTHPADYGIATNSTIDQYGMFASLRIYFDDAWSIVGGARISRDSTDTQFTIRNTLIQLPPDFLAASWGTDRVVTPYAGLMYSFDRQYSLYASYADIYLAHNGFPERTPGDLLEPMRGVNVEAGVKGEWRNGAVNGSLAVYRIEQRNISQPTEFTSPGVLGERNCCYIGVTSESAGVDAELSGELVAGWRLGAGYTYNQNESPEGDVLAIFSPKHLLKAWTTVRLPGAFNRWQIGGSLLAQTKTATRRPDCSDPEFDCRMVEGIQPAYAVLDLRAGFDVDRNWQVALSVNNVLDKRYYEFSDDSTLYVWHGAPRSWMLRIDLRY